MTRYSTVLDLSGLGKDVTLTVAGEALKEHASRAPLAVFISPEQMPVFSSWHPDLQAYATWTLWRGMPLSVKLGENI